MGQHGIRAGTMEARIQTHGDRAFQEPGPDGLGFQEAGMAGHLFRDLPLNESQPVVYISLHPVSSWLGLSGWSRPLRLTFTVIIRKG